MTAAAQTQVPRAARAAVDRRLLPGTAALALAAAALLLQLGGTLNHDSAWFLTATARFLDGARLYVDIVELNPPLAFYLTVPPVAAARLLGVASADAFVVYVFALIAGSLALSRAIAGTHDRAMPAPRRWIGVIALFALTWLPGAAFGQREHLIVVFALPYLVLVAMRASGRAVSPRLAMLAGLAGGVAFSIKPPFLIVPVMLEIYLRLVRGRQGAFFRAETLVLAAAVSAYALSIFVFTPEYVAFVVPLAGAVYGAYEAAPAAVLVRLETLLLPVAAAAVVSLRGRYAAPRFAETFLGAGAAFFALYVAQMKGWQYQLYPATAMLMLCAGAMLADAPARAAAFRTASVPALLLLILAIDLGARGNYGNAMTNTMLPLVREHAARGGLAVFSMNLSWGFPLATYANADWPSRFPTLWPLPGILQGRADPKRDQARLDRIERYMIDTTIDDLARRPPAAVIVDVREAKDYLGGRPFDYLDYFGRDPRFRALWSGYERVLARPEFHVYLRRPESAE
ncbi:MAG: hypothetical protein U1F37_20535 [Alphaproteobacteria bacterium]